jgi:predicted histone-like DNA-binding protein
MSRFCRFRVLYSRNIPFFIFINQNLFIMPILFNKVERINPNDHAAQKQWYPSLRTMKRIMEKDVAREITEENTMNRKEAEMVLGLLEKVLIKNLLSSNSVQIGDWGTFYLTCKGTPSKTKEGLTAQNISNLNIRFLPGKSLKTALAEATFLSAETLVTPS